MIKSCDEGSVNKEKNKKTPIIIAVGAIAVVAIVAVIVLILKKDDEYRLIKIQSYEQLELLPMYTSCM